MKPDPNKQQQARDKIGEPDIAILIEQLRSPDWVTSQAAAKQLVELGQRAFPALVRELGYPEGEVKRRAAYALAQMKAEDAVEPLIEVLDEDSDELVRWAAAVALGELADSSAIPSLISSLAEQNQNIARAASQALVQIAGPAVVPLINALFHTNYHVRRHAVDALSAIADNRAVKPLIAALEDLDSCVRSSAAEGLGAIGARDAVAPLIRVLDDQDSEVRGAAAVALGEIGDVTALPALRQLESDTGTTRDDRTVAEAAEEAIARIVNKQPAVLGPESQKAVYVIPGEQVTSLETFYALIGEAISGPGGYFGGNLDAFADCLGGGYGTPDEGYVLRWRNSEVSRVALGYAETVRQLESRLNTCHPDNRPLVAQELERAKRGEGPTVFDWLVEVIRVAEGVELRLE